MTAFAAVGAVVAPVVDDVVPQVHIPAPGRILVIFIDVRMVDTGVAAVVVGQDVVVEGGVLAAPEAAIAVISLRVKFAVLHGLGDQAPLEGEILVAIEGSRLVHAPTHGAVVQDHVIQVTAPDAVLAVGLAGCDVGFRPRRLVAQAETDEPDDDVGSLQVHRIVLQADAVARSRLARDGEVALGNLEVGLELDDAGDVEDDGAGPALVHGPAQRAFRTGVLQSGHVQHLAAASAGRVHAAALGAREGARETVLLHFGDGEIGIILLGRGGCRPDGILGSFRPGIEPGHGRGAAGIDRLHAELVVRRLGQVIDRGVAGAAGSFLHLGAVLLEFPGIGSRARHVVPLELEAGFRGLVQFQVRGGGRGRHRGRRIHRIVLLTAAGGQEKAGKGQEGQFFSHTYCFCSYSRDAQMKGPMPLGSFSMIFSWI